MTSGVKTTTAEEIVDLIRRQNLVDRDAAIALVEHYASVVASKAAIKATSEAYDKCIGITDEMMSKPLAPLPSADRRSA